MSSRSSPMSSSSPSTSPDRASSSRRRRERRRRRRSSSSSPSRSRSRSHERTTRRRRRRRSISSSSASDKSPSRSRSRSRSPPRRKRRARAHSSSESRSRSRSHSNERNKRKSHTPSSTTATAATKPDSAATTPAAPSAATSSSSTSLVSSSQDQLLARKLGFSPSLLTHPTLSLHPPLFRLRFTLRLTQTSAHLLAVQEDQAAITALVLELILNECGAYGKGSEDCIHRSHIEYIKLERAEEYHRQGKAKPSFAIFDAAALSQLTPANANTTLTQSHKTVWYGTVVIHFYTEASAQYIASHINGLNTNIQGYAVAIHAKLLASASVAYDLRCGWENFYFPGLSDSGGLSFPHQYQVALAFQRLPAGHRPDTLVLKYLPISWVDGSLLTKHARPSTRAKFYGTMEEDEVGSLSASDHESEDEDEVDLHLGHKHKRRTGPSARRLLRLVKRQFELLLKPAAKLAGLPTDTIDIRRWEYQPIDMSQYLKKTKVGSSTSSDVSIAPATTAAAESTRVDDDMLLFPQLNPFAEYNQQQQHQQATAREESKESPSSASTTSTILTPLCDVYLMLADYPTLLACFDYLHHKRLRNRSDTSSSLHVDPEEKESSQVGRMIDFGVDVDRDGYLRFERIENRRQVALDEYEKTKAAAQLAAHTLRKKKEEQARLERERLQRQQEEDAERARLAELAARQQQQRADEQAAQVHAAATALEARRDREARLEAERQERAAEKQRQVERRAAQRAEEDAERKVQEEGGNTEKELRQKALETLRRKQMREKEDEETAEASRALEAEMKEKKELEEQQWQRTRMSLIPPPPSSSSQPRAVIDLAALQSLDDLPGEFTPAATLILEQWFQANLERPFPSESVVQTLAKRSQLNTEQVRNWFVETRKTEWKMNGSQRSQQASYDDMPGLLSSSDEATLAFEQDSMAARVAAAAALPITMKLKARPKLQTDEDAAATVDGFVRVENLFDAQQPQNGLPSSHPLNHQIALEMLPNVVEPTPSPSPPPNLNTHANIAAAPAPPMLPVQHSPLAVTPTPLPNIAPSPSTPIDPRHAHLPSNVASALAALEAKLNAPPTDATGRPIDAEGAALIAKTIASQQRREREKKRKEREARSSDSDSSSSSSRSRSRSSSSSSSRSRSGSRSKSHSRHSKHKKKSTEPNLFMQPPPGAFFPPPYGFPPGMPPFGYPPFGFPPMMPGMQGPPPNMMPMPLLPNPAQTPNGKNFKSRARQNNNNNRNNKQSPGGPLLQQPSPFLDPQQAQAAAAYQYYAAAQHHAHMQQQQQPPFTIHKMSSGPSDVDMTDVAPTSSTTATESSRIRHKSSSKRAKKEEPVGIDENTRWRGTTE